MVPIGIFSFPVDNGINFMLGFIISLSRVEIASRRVSGM